jgi:hypothetical protein
MIKCVYIHKDLEDNIFYVGCGLETRPYDTQGRLALWWSKANNGYTVEIIKTNLTSDEAFKLERELILKYGRINNNTGILVNKNNGYKFTGRINNQKKLIDIIVNKPVINELTGETYFTIEEAANKNKIQVNLMIRILEGKTFIKKHKFKYLTIS